MGDTSQIVSVLASTMSSSTTTADNFFTSLEIVWYLKDKNCRYTGTARDNRIGNPPLKSIKEMGKKAVPCGKCDYVTSDDGILALRWKDNKIVTLLSTDRGMEPMSSVHRYCSDTKRKDENQTQGLKDITVDSDRDPVTLPTPTDTCMSDMPSAGRPQRTRQVPLRLSDYDLTH
ncbi:hypothetical protein CRUP_036732 [Coryphaenoides rupestris]|nr:hypothetical protein CRUP_036732 [Coryphaenoides rupestris]